jgi:hypothetical protein
MGKNRELERMAAEENAYSPPRTPSEIEQIVIMERLSLYNRGLPCGAIAVRTRLQNDCHLTPLPSVRTIGRILARNGLTYGRTGWYDGDEPTWLPASDRKWRPQKTTDL